jgi:hypothetical protein
LGTGFSTRHVNRRTLRHEIQDVEQTLRDLDVILVATLMEGD